MRAYLVNPSDVSFGTAVITPRWQYVLAAATPDQYGAPAIVDETIDKLDLDSVKPGDVVGIGIHTANALRGYQLGRAARERGAFVVFGGIHATLFPDEVREHGAAHAVVTGDGDLVWPNVLRDCERNAPQPHYDGGRVGGDDFPSARWDLLSADRYMWASVQTVRGCPKHCSFCSVWRTDGQTPRQRHVDAVISELVTLRRKGFRFIVLADDNFYPVPLADLAAADRRADKSRYAALSALRQERFELMAQMAKLPDDMCFYTQITMEAAEDPEFLAAMRRARIRGALVGVESVTPEGLKAVFKNFNEAGEGLVTRLKAFRAADVHVLGSFIFGLPTDTPETFAATADLAQRAEVSFAQFVMLTPLPGTLDLQNGNASHRCAGRRRRAADALLAHPVIAAAEGAHPHPRMSADETRARSKCGTGFTECGRGRVRPACDRSAPASPSSSSRKLPADVREYRHRHRQCARRALSAARTVAGASGAAAVHSCAHAASAGAGRSSRPRWPASCGIPRALNGGQRGASNRPLHPGVAGTGYLACRHGTGWPRTRVSGCRVPCGEGRSRADYGRASSLRTLPCSIRGEVATLGIVRIQTTPQRYIDAVADITAFKRDDKILQIGTFSTSPAGRCFRSDA